jgi:hypothetical protein
MGQQLSIFNGWEQPSHYTVKIQENRIITVNNIECGILQKVLGDGNCLLYSLSIPKNLHQKIRNYISECANRTIKIGEHLYIEDVQYVLPFCHSITCIICIVLPNDKTKPIWWIVVGEANSSFNSIRIIIHKDGCHYEPIKEITDIGKEYIGSIIHNFILDNPIPNVYQENSNNKMNENKMNENNLNESDEKIVELLLKDINNEILQSDIEYVKKLQSN